MYQLGFFIVMILEGETLRLIDLIGVFLPMFDQLSPNIEGAHHYRFEYIIDEAKWPSIIRIDE